MKARLVLAAAGLALTGVACGGTYTPTYDGRADTPPTTSVLERNNAEGRAAQASARLACDEAYHRLPGNTNAIAFAGAYADSFASRTGKPQLRGAAYQGCLEGLAGM